MLRSEFEWWPYFIFFLEKTKQHLLTSPWEIEVVNRLLVECDGIRDLRRIMNEVEKTSVRSALDHINGYPNLGMKLRRDIKKAKHVAEIIRPFRSKRV